MTALPRQMRVDRMHTVFFQNQKRGQAFVPQLLIVVPRSIRGKGGWGEACPSHLTIKKRFSLLPEMPLPKALCDLRTG